MLHARAHREVIKTGSHCACLDVLLRRVTWIAGVPYDSALVGVVAGAPYMSALWGMVAGTALHTVGRSGVRWQAWHCTW